MGSGKVYVRAAAKDRTQRISRLQKAEADFASDYTDGR